jgi:hypothetical protein
MWFCNVQFERFITLIIFFLCLYQIIRSLIRLVDYRGQKVSVIVLGYEYDMNFDETSNLIDGSPSRGTQI